MFLGKADHTTKCSRAPIENCLGRPVVSLTVKINPAETVAPEKSRAKPELNRVVFAKTIILCGFYSIL